MSDNWITMNTVKKSNDLLNMRYNQEKILPSELEFDIYVVKPGDTIESVAALFKMTPSKLCHINKLNMRTLLINQKLKVIKDKDVIIDQRETRTDNNGNKIIESELKDGLSLSLQSESELFPLLYKDNFMKVHVKYITDTEGIVNGTLLLTPEAVTFIPAFKDPVVHEYGIEKFSIHLPDTKIACVSMYSDSDVMSYKRTQRTMCNQIISHTHQAVVFKCHNEEEITKHCRDHDVNLERKLSLITEDTDQPFQMNSDSLLKNHDESNEIYLKNKINIKEISEHNFLCVIASPRYKKTKAIYQKEDEYWFMVPASSTESVLQYLLINGQATYGVGDNIDSQCTWPGEHVDSSLDSPNKKKLVKSSSFILAENTHNSSSDIDVSKEKFEFLREKSMDWEIINNDFDLSSFDCDEELEFQDSEILNTDQAKEFMNHMLKESVGAKWELIYSTSRDGWSLQTLYRKVFGSTRNACILIIKDTDSKIFGAMCNTYIRLSRRFYGNGQTFVFQWNPDFQKYNCTLLNDYILFGDPNYFVVGSSNSMNSIRLHNTLYDGISQPCDTFNSPSLSNAEFFQTLAVEVWSYY